MRAGAFGSYEWCTRPQSLLGTLELVLVFLMSAPSSSAHGNSNTLSNADRYLDVRQALPPRPRRLLRRQRHNHLAAANVAAAGMAARAGRPIGFLYFARIGIPVTLVSMLIATAYIAFRTYEPTQGHRSAPAGGAAHPHA